MLKAEPERRGLLRGFEASLVSEADLGQCIARRLNSPRPHQDVEIAIHAQRQISVVPLRQQRSPVRNVLNLPRAQMRRNLLQPRGQNQVAPGNDLALRAQGFDDPGRHRLLG